MTSSRLLRTSTIMTAVVLAAAGCNSHKNASSNVAPATATARPGSSTGAGVAGSKSCPAGAISGVIGGTSKCLRVGQQCSAKHLADYPQYGLACTRNGTRYILARKQ